MQNTREISKSERILNAAEKVFAAHGFEKATIDEIMALADVGKGTVYKYFGNKEQLFYQLVESKNKVFVADLQQAVDQGRNLKDKLINFFEVMIAFYEQNAALWQIICFEMVGGSNGCLVTMMSGKPQVISRFDTEPSQEEKAQMVRYHLLLASEFSILQRLMEEGVASGELDLLDTELSTMFIFFGVAMCIFHPHTATENMEPAEGARQTVDRFLYGAINNKH